MKPHLLALCAHLCASRAHGAATAAALVHRKDPAGPLLSVLLEMARSVDLRGHVA